MDQKFVVIVLTEGLLADVLCRAFALWGYDQNNIIPFRSEEAHKVPECLPHFGEKAVIVAGVFTRSEEEMAKTLLISVRTLREDCARCPFVLLSLDDQLPPILKSSGCHPRILPRDAASLQHIHKLQAISHKEREQFITDFGKPALWDKLVKDGFQLFHDFGKQSFGLKVAADDYQTLKERGQAFCASIRDSLDRLNCDASFIGVSLAEVWPETKDLYSCLAEMEKLCTAGLGSCYTQASKAVQDKREEGIKICELLQNRLKHKGGFSWKAG